MNSSDSEDLNARALALVRRSKPTSIAARKRIVAFRIVSGESIIMIARDTGIPVSTLYSWAAQREFREFVDNLRAEVLRECVGRLVDASTAAAETMIDIMKHDPDSSVRLRASRDVIDTLVKLREHDEFHRRIRVLEERYGQAIEADGDGGDGDGGDWDDGSGIAGLAAAPDGEGGAAPGAQEVG
jgi:transposase-like protein